MVMREGAGRPRPASPAVPGVEDLREVRPAQVLGGDDEVPDAAVPPVDVLVHVELEQQVVELEVALPGVELREPGESAQSVPGGVEHLPHLVVVRVEPARVEIVQRAQRPLRVVLVPQAHEPRLELEARGRERISRERESRPQRRLRLHGREAPVGAVQALHLLPGARARRIREEPQILVFGHTNIGLAMSS